jgi:nucleotide-binding universal stress UspA family protein
MEIGRILYATDMEAPNFKGVEQLMVLCKLGLEEVIFLNSPGVEDWGKRVANYGLKYKTLAGEGPFLSKILDAARQETVSMVAANLAPGGREVLGGPLVNHLLRSSPVPVMLLNEGAHGWRRTDKGVFHHVVFATDWSSVSESVLKILLNFKEVIEILEIVNVIHKKLSVGEMRHLKQRLVDTRKIFLEEGIDAETHVYAGKPHEEIMLAAREYNATSIFIGTSRKSPLRAFFSGSCSYRVAAEADIPVMVISHSVSL